MTQPHHTLHRTLKLSSVYAMAVGSAVGWGAFVLPYQWLLSSGLSAVLIGFLIATVLMTIIAMNYGYATRKLPVTGGGIIFALATLGKTHGFIAGWSLILGYMGIVALNASAVSLVFRLIFPHFMQQIPLYEISNWTIYLPEVLISSAFLVAFAYLNITNTAFSGRVQFLAVLFMLCAVGIIFVSTGIHFWYSSDSLMLGPPQGLSFWSACMVIIAFAPWAYVGFDSIPQLAGEFKFSPKKIMKLLIGSVISATLLYVAMVCASAFAFTHQLADFQSHAWATGSAIGQVMGSLGIGLLIIAVSMGVLTGLNGFYMAASRVFMTMGQQHMLPQAYTLLHPRYKTPYIAIYTIMIICLVSPWFGRAALLWIVDMTSVGIAMTFFYTCFCAYTLGKTGQLMGKTLQQPNHLQCVIGMLGCVISLFFLGLLIIPSSPAYLSTPSWYALLIWCIVGGWLYWSRRNKIKCANHHLISIP